MVFLNYFGSLKKLRKLKSSIPFYSIKFKNFVVHYEWRGRILLYSTKDLFYQSWTGYLSSSYFAHFFCTNSCRSGKFQKRKYFKTFLKFSPIRNGNVIFSQLSGVTRLFKNGRCYRRNQNNGYSQKWQQQWCRGPRFFIDFNENIEISLEEEIFDEKSDHEDITIIDIEEQVVEKSVQLERLSRVIFKDENYIRHVVTDPGPSSTEISNQKFVEGVIYFRRITTG